VSRCICASVESGTTRVIAARNLLATPATTSSLPSIMASKPFRATSAALIFSEVPNLGVHHIRALEKVGLRGSWHQAGHGNAGILKLVAERNGEGVEECLGAIVDCLEGTGHQTGNGAGNEYPALPSRTHI